MNLSQIVIGFFVAFVVMNAWTRLKWRLGFFPLHHNTKQAHITAKQAAQAMLGHMKQRGGAFGDDASPEMLDGFMTDMYCFARQTIMNYTRQMELQSFDTTADPPGIRKSRQACGEVV
jgi:hypothetical protein